HQHSHRVLLLLLFKSRPPAGRQAGRCGGISCKV
ncbi:MAG: hypothetical protein ACI81P_003406, partial [Neolewinella sp.]